jgi:hypothetical protein
MTPKAKEPSRRQRWLPYVRSIADLLALKDWRIVIYESKPDGVASIAEVEAVYGRKLATICLVDRHFDHDRVEQRHTIVHELVHCQIAPYVKAVERRTDNDSDLHMLMEYAVDGLADAIAPLVPLPPKGL